MLAIAAFLFSCEKNDLEDILGGESSRETTEVVETDGEARLPLAEDDSIRVKDRCDSLHMALRKAEKGSDQAKRLRKAIAENCKKPKRDKKAECKKLMEKLKTLDKGSDDAKRLKAIIEKKCECSKDGEGERDGEKKERKEKGDKKDKSENRDE